MSPRRSGPYDKVWTVQRCGSHRVSGLARAGNEPNILSLQLLIRKWAGANWAVYQGIDGWDIERQDAVTGEITVIDSVDTKQRGSHHD